MMKRFLIAVFLSACSLSLSATDASLAGHLRLAPHALAAGCTFRAVHSNATTADDVTNTACVDSGRLYNQYLFATTPGTKVTIAITAPKFTPSLSVVDPATGSVIGVVTASSGTHTVGASFNASRDFYGMGLMSVEGVPGPVTIKVTAPGVSLTCIEEPNTLCLLNRRFMIEALTLDYSDNTGLATVVPNHTNDASNLWFFESSNWEVLAKVKDACVAPFNHVWFFAGSTTNVGYSITVTDTKTGLSKIYSNTRGVAAPAIVDTEYFTCN